MNIPRTMRDGEMTCKETEYRRLLTVEREFMAYLERIAQCHANLDEFGVLPCDDLRARIIGLEIGMGNTIREQVGRINELEAERDGLRRAAGLT